MVVVVVVVVAVVVAISLCSICFMEAPLSNERVTVKGHFAEHNKKAYFGAFLAISSDSQAMSDKLHVEGANAPPAARKWLSTLESWRPFKGPFQYMPVIGSLVCRQSCLQTQELKGQSLWCSIRPRLQRIAAFPGFADALAIDRQTPAEQAMKRDSKIMLPSGITITQPQRPSHSDTCSPVEPSKRLLRCLGQIHTQTKAFSASTRIRSTTSTRETRWRRPRRC